MSLSGKEIQRSMGVASPQLKTLLLESISSTTSLMRLLSDFPEISTSEVMSYDIKKLYCEGLKRCQPKNQESTDRAYPSTFGMLTSHLIRSSLVGCHDGY